ncbi:MAG TPA: hypothetical protein VFC51_00025 [Chloroflexota bacterium]|nr:hypothetical protein [Chloroflexota bacterium]
MEDATLIDPLPHGSWRASKARVGQVELENPQLTVRVEGGEVIAEVSGECPPWDLTTIEPYVCSVEANRMTWDFRGVPEGAPSLGAMRRGQIWHRVAVRSQGEVRARRLKRT